jgi:hypothetical protein
MPSQFKHFFLSEWFSTIQYTPLGQRGKPPRLPEREPIAHSQRLLSRFNELWQRTESREVRREAVSIPTKQGTYIEFYSQAGFDLITKSLEDVRQGIRLLNVRDVSTADPDSKQTLATVYVPPGKERHFIKKIEDYQNTVLASSKPKNDRLVNSIEDVRLAMLESLWTDPPEHLPAENPVWCEAWLRTNDDEDNVASDFMSMLEQLGIQFRENNLSFPERTVMLIYANQSQLSAIIDHSDHLAEFRIGQETAAFWMGESNIEQSNWVEDLLGRLVIEESNTYVCLLDSGVNNGHRLIEPLLPDENCLTVDPEWRTGDHQPGSGHGTLMCGIAAYRNLEAALLTRDAVIVSHKLCSVKVLPRPNQEPTRMELWGDITDQGISRTEIRLPDGKVIYCLSVTADNDIDRGRPSSWSGALDKTTFGDLTSARLVIVSAGNVVGEHNWLSYPDSNQISTVKNPAQSWNALTIGAYTEKISTNDGNLKDYVPLAPHGGLSPFSPTSLNWDQKRWPVKPDLVFEGGNIIKSHDGTLIEGHDDFCLLSTSKNIRVRQFDTVNATSAAAAQAAWLAAKIQSAYPDAWPETVRGLMVHAASWKEGMIKQFGINTESKTDVKKLLRIFGYGVPDLNKAIHTSSKYLTYISEAHIQPFEKGSSRCKTREMHFYELPWPKEELLANPDIEVSIRITLSYFIEPGPGEVGWKDKYRYRSHGLCFDLNSETESETEFKKRINLAARAEDEDLVVESGSKRWLIGMNGRKSGSVHSDIWKGTAAQLASCNLLAIYPIIGWWRQRTNLKKYNSKARYSLIVSIDAPNTAIDLYTPVINMIRQQVVIET